MINLNKGIYSGASVGYYLFGHVFHAILCHNDTLCKGKSKSCSHFGQKLKSTVLKNTLPTDLKG